MSIDFSQRSKEEIRLTIQIINCMAQMEVETILLSILTSIITGGFILVFVEIGNRKNRENDRYDQIMRPFMHKLSSYFRFLSWCSHHIIYPSKLNAYEQEFKRLVEEIGRYGRW